MATRWHAKGEYMEACSCDFLCPCITKNLTTPATHEFCKVALGFEIESGDFGGTRLDGVRFVMFAQSKALMSAGDWIAGLVIDESATDDQTEAVRVIATAEGNGPLALFSPLITDFRGIERRPIEFHKNGSSVRIKIEGLLDQEIAGVASITAPGECVAIDNVGHPVNKRLNLATAVRNVISAFGIDWRGQPDRTNGHFAPFAWQGEAA